MMTRRSPLYAARLDGWASRKYGEDWRYEQDYYAVIDEFAEWLKAHDDE